MRISLLIVFLPLATVHDINYAYGDDVRSIQRVHAAQRESSNSRSFTNDASMRMPIGRRQSVESSKQDARWGWPSVGAPSSLVGYYDRFVRRPLVDWVVPEVNSSLLRPLHSFLTGLPSYATISTGIKRYPYSNDNTYESASTHHESPPHYTQHLHSNVVNKNEYHSTGTSVPSEMQPPLFHPPAAIHGSSAPSFITTTTTTHRPHIPILNEETLSAAQLDSDESFLSPVDSMDSYDEQSHNYRPLPHYDVRWQEVHRPQTVLPVPVKKYGLYQAGPTRTTISTTSTTTPAPGTAKPTKEALSGTITLGKLPTITFGNNRRPIQHLPYGDTALEPHIGGKPAIVTNPYINIGHNPEIKLLGMKIQKQFGLQMGIKIVKPQRFPGRPFSFLTPLIGGAISPKPPPAGLVPILHGPNGPLIQHHAAIPSFLHPPLHGGAEVHGGPHSHSDIIIGKQSRSRLLEEETQLKIRVSYRTPEQ